MKTVRLKKELESKLASYAEEHNMTESSVIREALEEYIERHQKKGSSFELGKAYFGRQGSDQTDNSERYKAKLKAKIREKTTG
jgi:predicted transcriptional regulator